MLQLIVGLVLFLGTHSISIVSLSTRDALAARMGELPFKIVYAIVSIVGLILIVRGYGEARLDPTIIYTTPEWTRHVTMLVMLPAFPALLAAYLPGRISQALGHPMLVAVKAWALAHLLVNGTLADVLLFGGFLAWAVADRVSMKRRPERDIPRLPRTAANDVIVVLGGIGIYLAFVFWLHARWIGVPVVG